MSIYEQLTEYCDCLVTAETDGDGTTLTPKFTQNDVDELVNLVSTYTCWAQSPCETFLQSARREVIELPDCVRGNCDVFTFEPFFTPFDSDSFVFTLVEQNGITETQTELTSLIYSEADGNFRIELGLPSCKCRPSSCGCKSKYKLMVDYTAGYEELPDCLLPLFCEALQWIIQKNECDCEECEDCTNKYADTKQIDYTSLTGTLQAHFLEVLTKQYFRQLGLISLCRSAGALWGVVV